MCDDWIFAPPWYGLACKLESVVHMVDAGPGGFTVGIVSPVSGEIAVDHAV